MTSHCNNQRLKFDKPQNITNLLKMKLNIPDYQRPYKWKIKNIEELLNDISIAIEDAGKYSETFKYRVGTIILHENDDGIFDIVDGQQRIISLLLISLYLVPDFSAPILEKQFTNKETQTNIHTNYIFIKEWFSFKRDEDKKKFIRAFDEILEVVLVSVEKVSEAFQLFDSQNTRGKALDPHDLLKAYHLREMKEYPYEMQHAVTKWEGKDTFLIRELFDIYLFPIWNWSRGIKSRPFTAKEIDTYKGVPESLPYTYAHRARKAMPCFQITETFISGNDFFEMVEHYLHLLTDIKTEILKNKCFSEIKAIICRNKEVSSIKEMDSIKYGSAGFTYARNLFYCALLCYYDKFHNFDVMAVKKIFTWAFMLRVDMDTLGFDSINKYAIGNNDNFRYTNSIAMFSKISVARLHNEISSLQIKVKRELNTTNNEMRDDIHRKLKFINGLLED